MSANTCFSMRDGSLSWRCRPRGSGSVKSVKKKKLSHKLSKTPLTFHNDCQAAGALERPQCCIDVAQDISVTRAALHGQLPRHKVQWERAKYTHTHTQQCDGSLTADWLMRLGTEVRKSLEVCSDRRRGGRLCRTLSSSWGAAMQQSAAAFGVGLFSFA